MDVALQHLLSTCPANLRVTASEGEKAWNLFMKPLLQFSESFRRWSRSMIVLSQLGAHNAGKVNRLLRQIWSALLPLEVLLVQNRTWNDRTVRNFESSQPLHFSAEACSARICRFATEPLNRTEIAVRKRKLRGL